MRGQSPGVGPAEEGRVEGGAGAGPVKVRLGDWVIIGLGLGFSLPGNTYLCIRLLGSERQQKLAGAQNLSTGGNYDIGGASLMSHIRKGA